MERGKGRLLRFAEKRQEKARSMATATADPYASLRDEDVVGESHLKLMRAAGHDLDVKNGIHVVHVGYGFG
jgi:hypothetical protein